MTASNTIQHPLAGKIALVTGGSRGIGAAIVKRLAANGAAVALTYNTSSEKASEVVESIQSTGGKALAMWADASETAAVKAAVAMTVQTFGGIDILVNNAGIVIAKSIDAFTIEDFDRIVNINMKGLFITTQESLRHMGHGGRVINIGSISSNYEPFGNCGLYVMTKAAVAGLTQALARDLGPRGITINNVMPGPTDTDMNPATSERAARRREYVALKRYAHVDEIADVVAYLATPGASYITGASIVVDGGYSA